MGVSKNKFKLSDDESYWIGYTQKGDEFWFDGDKCDYIKECTWRKINNRYFQNSKGEKLHRVVMGVTDRCMYVNNKTLNITDNRICNLEITTELGNVRNKKVSKRNSSGITGLMTRGKSWVGNIKIDDISLYSKYKTKDEAIIDMLIMQKHYGFTHNEDMFYKIENISNDRYNEVISNCERQLSEKRNKTQAIPTSNTYILSECETFYTVVDEKGNSFLIDVDMLDKVKQGKWFVANDKSNFGKLYVKGTVLINNKRKSVKLHRFLFDIVDNKYKIWVIDHVNGNGLDNRFENMVITDAKGNGHKVNSKGYSKRNDTVTPLYRVNCTFGGIRYDKSFKTEEEALNFVEMKRNEFLNNRLQFKNRNELDTYLELN